MIVKGILDLFKGFILFIVGLIPPIPDLTFLVDPVSKVIHLFHGVELFLDVNLFMKCVSICFVFSNIRFIWAIIMWVIRKIPFLN